MISALFSVTNPVKVCGSLSLVRSTSFLSPACGEFVNDLLLIFAAIGSDRVPFDFRAD